MSIKQLYGMHWSYDLLFKLVVGDLNLIYHSNKS